MGMVAVCILAVGVGSAAVFESLYANRPDSLPTADLQHANSLSLAFRYAAKEVTPSVVTIQKTAAPVVKKSSGAPNAPRVPDELRGTPFEQFFGDDRFDRFFDHDDMPQPRGESGMGSGVIIDSSGVILTNHHVVAGPGKVTVRLANGEEYDAVEIKSDERTDLAIVRIEGAGDLKAARLGDSDQLEIGDWVVAIGNPFGLTETVTAGIISAKARGLGIAQREDFLQTDAAINPGNSGGPLINLKGEIVGINTAISTRSGGYQGIGFAIPANLARWVSKQLIADGAVKRAYLGTAIQPLTKELAQQLGVTVHEGAVVSEVFDGSPAADAGLKPGDVIVAFNGKEVGGPRELVAAVESAAIDSTAKVRILRGEKESTVDVKVRLQPEDYGQLAGRKSSSGEDNSAEFNALGLAVGPLSDEVAEQLDLKGIEGVAITSVERGSLAERSGLEPGMAITEVNRKKVASVDEFGKALEERSLKQGVLLLVQTPSGSRFVALRAAK
jgi:serine protease Do